MQCFTFDNKKWTLPQKNQERVNTLFKFIGHYNYPHSSDIIHRLLCSPFTPLSCPFLVASSSSCPSWSLFALCPLCVGRTHLVFYSLQYICYIHLNYVHPTTRSELFFTLCHVALSRSPLAIDDFYRSTYIRKSEALQQDASS